MEFYSFQYPPRQAPSDAHRPSCYYFHNLEQDQSFKRTQFGFQKEGVAPKAVSATVAANANLGTNMGMTMLTDAASMTATPKAAPMSICGIEVLDRKKFLVN